MEEDVHQAPTCQMTKTARSETKLSVTDIFIMEMLVVVGYNTHHPQFFNLKVLPLDEINYIHSVLILILIYLKS